MAVEYLEIESLKKKSPILYPLENIRVPPGLCVLRFEDH